MRWSLPGGRPGRRSLQAAAPGRGRASMLPAMELSGTAAIISGGASGLGEATARALAAAGGTIVLADLNEESGKKVADEIGGEFVKTDVSDEASVAAAVAVAAGKEAPPEFAQAAARYAREQDDIQKDAREKEHARDEKSGEADRLLVRHHGFANAVALFQIAIALGAVAALTRARSVWLGSLLVGLGAVGLLAWQWIR